MMVPQYTLWTLTTFKKFTRGESLKLNKHHVEDLGEYSEDLLKKCSLDSDVVITGVPSENYKFPTEYIKKVPSASILHAPKILAMMSRKSFSLRSNDW